MHNNPINELKCPKLQLKWNKQTTYFIRKLSTEEIKRIYLNGTEQITSENVPYIYKTLLSAMSNEKVVNIPLTE